MSLRKNEINEYLHKLKIISEVLKALRHFHEETIQSLSWMNRVIDRNLNDVRFLIDLYEPLDQRTVDTIPENDYPAFVLPLANLTQFGTTFVSLQENTKNVQKYIDKFEPIASSMSATFAMSAGDSTVSFAGFTKSVSSERERLRELLDRYLEQLRPEEEIRYIETRLAKLIPDVSRDFRHFLVNYHASNQDELKYQELIGFRSFFFMKLIDAFAANRGFTDTTPRRGRILVFTVSQPTSNDQHAKQLAEAAMSLWKDLSTQDAAALSVKMGNVTSEYVNLLFNRTIIVASALLRQNELTFK